MKIGMIGAGSVSLAIAAKALAKGHRILLSSHRGPESLADKVKDLGVGASAATVIEAAQQEFVLLAVPWVAVEKTLTGLPSWDGRVLIDATNPFTETHPAPILADLGGLGASEIVAALAPGARVIKAFNSVTMEHFSEGASKEGGRRVIFVSGDHLESKSTIKSLIESLGFAAIDLGSLVAGGRMQQAGGPLAGVDLIKA